MTFSNHSSSGIHFLSPFNEHRRHFSYTNVMTPPAATQKHPKLLILKKKIFITNYVSNISHDTAVIIDRYTVERHHHHGPVKNIGIAFFLLSGSP